MIESDFEGRAFLEPQIAIAQDSGESTEACSRTRADSGALASSVHCSANRTDACADGGSFDHALLIHAFTLNITFFIGLGALFAGNAGNGGFEGNPSVIGFNFIEAEQHARVQALLDGTYVTFDFLAAGNRRAVRGNEVFAKFDFEVFAGLKPSGVELVLETNQKRSSFGNRVPGIRSGRLFRLQGQ
jgi:hypothetical protein